MSKILTAYFSASGNTEKLARMIAEKSGSDLFQIVPVQPYTSDDLNWMNKQSRSSIEMADPSCRPEISELVKHMDQYDVVLLGFPIWWYIAPRIIETFLEMYDFSGKTIIPFATSGGSGMGRTVAVLKECCSNGTKWNEGRRFGSADGQEVSQWLRSLCLQTIEKEG